MEIEIIKNSIHEIRGKNTMLDMDLAKLYEVETKALKQAVRRNIEKFLAFAKLQRSKAEDFLFTLTLEEWNALRSQFVTLEGGKGNHPKYLPFAFTEQGVAMLSAVLNSTRAVHTSISIMRAFVLMRQWALNHHELSKSLDALEQQFGQKIQGHRASLELPYTERSKDHSTGRSKTSGV